MADHSEFVWLLTITNSNGSETYICADEDVAQDQLFEYVDDCWDLEFTDDIDNYDRDEAIRKFFQESTTHSRIIVEKKVLTEVVE